LDQNELIDEKKLIQKISWDCPFKGAARILPKFLKSSKKNFGIVNILAGR